MPTVCDRFFRVFRYVIRAACVLVLLATFLAFPEQTVGFWSPGSGSTSGLDLPAEEAFAEAERLRNEWKEPSLRMAIEKYQQSLRYWRVKNNARKQAEVLSRIGKVYAVFGETANALANYQQALNLSRRIDHHSLKVESLNNVCSVLNFRGDRKSALDHCNEALRLSRRTGNRSGEAQALNNIGEANYVIDMNKALVSFEQALVLVREIADQRGEAHTLTNIGYIYTDWSDLQQAWNYFTQAIAIWNQVGDISGEARTVNAVGVLHAKLGEKQKALAQHIRARELFRTIGNQPGELTALTGIGYVYDSMGEKEKALNQYDEALRITRAVGHREAELVLLVHVGNVHQALEKKDEALKNYVKALQLSRALGDVRMQAYSLRFIGEIQESSGSLTRALHHYERALSLSRRSADKRGEAAVLNHIGSICELTDQKRAALNHYTAALGLHLVTKDRQGEAWTRYNLARVYRDQGELKSANSEITASIGIIDSLRTNVGSHDLRLSYFATVQQYYALHIDILMQMHKAHPTQGFDAIAFRVSGRARARNLLDLLVESRFDFYRSIDPLLAERENKLRQTLNAKSERQARLLSGSYSREDAAHLAAEIDKIAFELEEIRAQIREQSPRYATLIEPPALSVKDVQDMLDEDTLLIEYALGEKRSYLWTVNKTRIDTFELPDRATIEQAARRLHELLSARETAEQYWQHAVALGRMILDPASMQLGKRRLLVVAEGALLLVPFGALATSNGMLSSQQTTDDVSQTTEPVPLMFNHEIVNLPSASTLAVLRNITAHRQVAPKAVAVLADPVFERIDPRLDSAPSASYVPAVSPPDDVSLLDTGSRIARLLASREEADDIVQMAPRGTGLKIMGFDANLETVKDSRLAQYRIVHFATHGIFKNDHPELSGIVLSLYDQRGHRRPGFLGLQEIYNLNLPVELVVLSACNTSLGKEVWGEGLIGVTRGFMYAGASRVMSSLWKVDEDATAELMKHFYEGVLKERLSPAAALRRAQIKMWQIKRWRSPYYWAAFVLHGEYRDSPLIASEKSNRIQTITVGICIILVSLIALYLLRRATVVTRRP